MHTRTYIHIDLNLMVVRQNLNTKCACKSCATIISFFGTDRLSCSPKNVCLFSKRALENRPNSAKETSNFKEPTNCNRPSLLQPLHHTILLNTKTFSKVSLLLHWQCDLTIELIFENLNMRREPNVRSLDLFFCLIQEDSHVADP